jgi:uncharacterized protein (TIGR02118 family)
MERLNAAVRSAGIEEEVTGEITLDHSPKYEKKRGISIGPGPGDGKAVAFPSPRRYIFAEATRLSIHRSLHSPMIKLIALYRNPSDTAEFDKHYFEVHIPLVRKFPGLRRLEVTRVTGAPIGEAKFHLMAEMYFDTKDAMDAALASAEGKAVTRDIMSFAADVITVFHGETD